MSTPAVSTDSVGGADAWEALRRFTAARIALGHAGVSLPTAPLLAFRLAHARARDAVHTALDVDALRGAIRALDLDTLDVKSAAPDRGTYLRRPDLGRQLDEHSRAELESHPVDARTDLVFVVADGLSARAVQSHAAPFLESVLPLLEADGWAVGPVVIASQGRVALGDEIGEALGVRAVVVMIGERPGLSSPDSMGLYLTWTPKRGLTDAARNCISNVRPEGLAPPDAAARLAWLLREARARNLSGVALKDESGPAAPRVEAGGRNFLLPGG